MSELRNNLMAHNNKLCVSDEELQHLHNTVTKLFEQIEAKSKDLNARAKYQQEIRQCKLECQNIALKIRHQPKKIVIRASPEKVEKSFFVTVKFHQYVYKIIPLIFIVCTISFVGFLIVYFANNSTDSEPESLVTFPTRPYPVEYPSIPKHSDKIYDLFTTTLPGQQIGLVIFVIIFLIFALWRLLFA